MPLAKAGVLHIGCSADFADDAAAARIGAAEKRFLLEKPQTYGPNGKPPVSSQIVRKVLY
jgi:acyl-coenzyme A synthetase/AMP-(fatty) acid ligase